MKQYGKTEDDVALEKKIQCRNIVKEIVDFGVDEDQKILIIKLLSLEYQSVRPAGYCACCKPLSKP